MRGRFFVGQRTSSRTLPRKPLGEERGREKSACFSPGKYRSTCWSRALKKADWRREESKKKTICFSLGRGSACRNDPPAKTERVYKSRIKESAYFIVETSEILLLDAGTRGQTAFLYRKKARGSARPSQGRGRAFSCETSVKQAKYGLNVAFFQRKCSIFCF